MNIDLDAVYLFQGLCGETRVQLTSTLFQRDYPASATILIEGEPCQAVYFIAKGEVQVYRTSPEGREQVLARLSKGQAFNTVPPLQPKALQHASARAFSDATLYGLRTTDYLRLLQNCADFCYAVLHDFASRLDYLTDLVEDLSFHSVRGRLARFLIEQADRPGAARNWTQDEIAEHIGSVRDVVGRTLKAFTEEGLIRRERKQIYLVDRGRLEAEAEN